MGVPTSKARNDHLSTHSPRVHNISVDKAYHHYLISHEGVVNTMFHELLVMYAVTWTYRDVVDLVCGIKITLVVDT